MTIHEIKIDTPEYPYSLTNIEDAPEKLFCHGNTTLLNIASVAIVGTRRASPYGKWVATKIAKSYIKQGVPIVTSLADGINSAVIQECILNRHPVIAVMGTPVDMVFPRSCMQLYKRIPEIGGLLVSEQPSNSGPVSATSFVYSKRILAGLSQLVIVVEASTKSGSLITANLALQQGKDVFAVPGNINNPNAIGTNMLIADGAGVITDIEDVPVIK